MAICTPYGDPNAHGTIGKSISFRRQFGRVILQKAPFPFDPNTSAQQTQRTAFKTANYNWYQLPTAQKTYYNVRGPELGISPRNLYISASLKGILPSYTSRLLREVLTAQIMQPIGTGATDIEIEFYFRRYSPDAWIYMWNIYDNQNVLAGTSNVLPAGRPYIKVINTIDIPFRYGIFVTWADETNFPWPGTIRLPALSAGTHFIDIGDDYSAYTNWDSTKEFIATNLF